MNLTWNLNVGVSIGSGSTGGIRSLKQEWHIRVFQEQGGQGQVSVGELGGKTEDHSANGRNGKLIKPM